MTLEGMLRLIDDVPTKDLPDLFAAIASATLSEGMIEPALQALNTVDITALDELRNQIEYLARSEG